MSRTDTPPVTDKKMWARLLRTVHPDHGGDDELFIWVNQLRSSMHEEHRNHQTFGEPYDDVLNLLTMFIPFDKRATPKQMAFISHLAGFTQKERQGFYKVADMFGLSNAQAKHLIKELR